jgi:CRISPR-associated endonuclease/helicase Cas3
VGIHTLQEEIVKLYDYQVNFARCIRQGRNIVLQAPTGAGKTMAALWPFLRNWADSSDKLPRKCVYAVPMRVLANQFVADYSRIVYEDMLIASPPIIKRQTGEYKEDPEFRADITFATIDQVLSGWLMSPFGLPRRLGNLNAGACVGSYLVFDEFHLFDPDSTLPTTLQMLKTLNDVSPFVLMTATFSKEMLNKLAGYLDAEAFLLTDEMLKEIPAQNKERRFYTVSSPLTYINEDKKVLANETSINHILQSHRDQTGDKPRTLVVCNQVERAQAVYTALRHHGPDGVDVRLLHSRFLRQDRQEIESHIRQEFGKNTDLRTIDSLIVVATQVVEVGLDMSCAVLHTELAPAASVLQRAGRCARYPNQAGQVYVYPLDGKGYAPYHGKYARQQCDLAWEWLQANQDRHLTFADEQDLINHAHSDSDDMILKGVFETEFELLSEIRAAWRGEKGRAETAGLIRNIQSVSIVVHSDPDQLSVSPFKADSFSLHPGTLKGKFKHWQEVNEALDPGFDEGHLDWLVKKLVEDVDEQDVQSNTPITYRFKKVSSGHELDAPLLAINPSLIGYSAKLGLTLYPGNAYQSSLPEAAVAQQYEAFNYKLESYYRHIALVHQAFVDESLDLFNAVAGRLERAYDWRPGIITDMAHLVMAVHDVGKLSQTWQGWAHRWQSEIGRPMADANDAAAHTDYDPENPVHKGKNKMMRGKRPSHAVESALAALPVLKALVASDSDRYMPLLRAAFTAVARHHAPFSSQPGSYQLVSTYQQEIEATLELLPERVRRICQAAKAFPAIDIKYFSVDLIKRSFLLDVRDETALCCYMLLVRALRTADQKGTSLGSQ